MGQSVLSTKSCDTVQRATFSTTHSSSWCTARLKAGIGRARFGQLDRAERLLASALRIADEAGLHEFTFRIERIQAGLRDCDCAEPAAESALGSEAVKEVSASLAELGA